jgi:uncharacterized protein
MNSRGWMERMQRGLKRMGAMLMVLGISPCVFAQGAAPSCPPPLAQPTQEKMQALFKSAKDRGFLWKIEKDGKSGHLFGSMHVGKEAWSIPGPKTMAAFVGSDIVALELDILDPAIQADMANPAKFGIKPLELSPTLKSRLDTLAARVCAPVKELSAMHPMMQVITITLFDARFMDLEIAYGSEIFLSGFARGANKPVESLESVALQLRTLLGGEPQPMLAGIDRSLVLMEQGKSRPITERMVNAWASGNLNELETYQKWCECATTDDDRKALQTLNDERNPKLAAGIDKLMSSGKTVFAAVGALHMTGPKALPKLLQEMGYKVERVVFDN